MTDLANAAADLMSLEAVQAALAVSDPDNRLAPIGLRRIEIGRAAIDELPGAVMEIRRGGPVAMLADATPMRRRGRDLKDLVESMLAASFDVVRCTLGEPEAPLKADDATIDTAVALVADTGCVVAVGSGTVTDIAKEATLRAGNVPLAVVQGAASVNAFSDNMAVVLRDGVKRSLPSRWPDVLLVDLEVLASAPPAMNSAGFGDILGLWTAPADWMLASLVGMDDTYHPAVLDLLRRCGEPLLTRASDIGARRLDGLDALASALTLTGIALGVAGSTAALSGAEHGISHLLDARAAHDGRAIPLHGAQVGVATVVAAALWERALRELEPRAIDLRSVVPADEDVRSQVHDAWRELDPSGQISEACWAECRKKLDRWRGCGPALARLMDDWESHCSALAACLRPPADLAHALRDARAVSAFERLEPPVSAQAVQWAVASLPFLRNRFTIADLLLYCGLWDEQLIESVLADARACGALV